MRAISEVGGLVVEWIQAGAIIDAPAIGQATEPVMVLGSCASESPAAREHVYFCATCRCNLANQGQLEIHLEKSGTHRVAIWCSARRVYEAARPIPLSIFAAAEAAS